MPNKTIPRSARCSPRQAPEDAWVEVSFDGNRRREHERFLALPLAEKIKRLEQAQEVSAHFAKSRAKGLSQKSKERSGVRS